MQLDDDDEQASSSAASAATAAGVINDRGTEPGDKPGEAGMATQPAGSPSAAAAAAAQRGVHSAKRADPPQVLVIEISS